MYKQLHRCFSAVLQNRKILYASFYSAALYTQVVKHWHGLGMRYLLFLIMLGTIPLSGRVILEFKHFYEEEILFPIQVLPLLTIQNGDITYNQRMPYLIKNKKGKVVSIIDTTGTNSEINRAYPQLTVLITKNTMHFRPPSYKKFLGLAKDSLGNPIYTRTFDKNLNGFLSGVEWIRSSGISKLITLIQIIIFPCITLFYFAFFGIILLLLSALVQLYSDIFFNFKLTFKTAYRLSTVAVTPTLLLFFFIRYGNFTPSKMGLVYGVLFLGYVSYGLYSVKWQRGLFNFINNRCLKTK